MSFGTCEMKYKVFNKTKVDQTGGVTCILGAFANEEMQQARNHMTCKYELTYNVTELL